MIMRLKWKVGAAAHVACNRDIGIKPASFMFSPLPHLLVLPLDGSHLGSVKLTLRIRPYRDPGQSNGMALPSSLIVSRVLYRGKPASLSEFMDFITHLFFIRTYKFIFRLKVLIFRAIWASKNVIIFWMILELVLVSIKGIFMSFFYHKSKFNHKIHPE